MSGPIEGRESAASERLRHRWRARQAGTPARAPAARLSRRVGWTLASGAALAALIAIVILSLFSRRTAVVLLSIDDYEHGLVSPVAFGPQDLKSIEAAVAGRLSRWVAANRGPLSLDAYQTADAMRAELGQTMRGLSVGSGDAMVAVVRGQMLVAPGPDGRPQACLLAEDVNLDRAFPAELVPCRKLFSALASSRARTTLIVLDMGDLRWDLRLGVTAGLVPAVLDEECREPLPDAAGECWVLGSHDVHEFSGVSVEDGRGVFLRAVELAVAGRADDASWGGDGDGLVELHEMARFVAAWTSAWSRRESGGDFDQRPVLWKLGTGRVPLEASIARDIRLIEAARPLPLPSASFLAEDAVPKEPVSRTEQPVSAQPVDNGSPESVPTPATRSDVWDFIDRLADRDADGVSPAESCPVDYAPHLWRETVAAAAAAAATPRDGSPLGDRAERIESLLQTGLESFLLGDRGQSRFDGRETPLARLADSRRRAATGVAVAWRNGDGAVRAALAARNRGVELATAALDYFGSSVGSGISRPFVRSLPPLIDAIAGLHAELSRLATASADEPSDALVRLAAAVDTAGQRLLQDVKSATDELVRRIDRGSNPLPAADLHWFSVSRLPTAEHRRRLAEVVATRLRKPVAAAPKSPVEPATAREAGRESGQSPPRLTLEGVLPPVPADRGPSARSSREKDAWKDVGDRLDLVVRLLNVFGTTPAFQESDQAIKVFHETTAGAETAKSTSAPVASAAGAGHALAAALAKIPADIDRLLRTPAGSLTRPGDQAAAIDSLLRLSDSRDAARVPSDAFGWVPRVRVALPLRLAVTSTDDPLEIGRARRVSIGLQSGDVFPAEGNLSLEFDPERLKIRTLGGGEIRPRTQVPVKDLSDRARLLVLVEPRRQIAAGDSDRMATVRADLVVGSRRDHGERRFQLPVMERLLVSVRGRAGTVEGGDEQLGGWRRLPVDPLAKAPGETSGETSGETPVGVESASSIRGGMRLRPFPGQVTAWEVALSNQSGERRCVDVELLSVGTFPHGQSTALHAEAKDAWRSFVTGLERGLPAPATCRSLAATGPILLPATEDRVAVLLPPPRPADGKSPTDVPAPLGTTLALIIRDRSEAAANAKEEDRSAEPAPAVRPAEKRRTWVVQLPLIPKRPKTYLSASATWSMQNRSIDIAVEPLHGDQALLPEAPVVLRAAPLPGADNDSPSPVLRIMQATVSGAQKNAVLRADWNGGEGRPAELGIDVDGYPRAFVFRIDSRPVMDGVEQRPQRDWRHLSFLRPTNDYQAYRPGGDAVVPLGLAVDLPEDMLGGATPPLDVVLREVRQRSGGLAADRATAGWATTMDRQVEYAAATASPPSAFAVRSTVVDWNFPLATPGFTDVDVVIEARLRLSDSQLLDAAKRLVVFDGTPPHADVPSQARVEKGKVATIEIDCDDGDRNTVKVEGRRPGSSGVVKAEWAIDVKRNGQPDAWQAVQVEGATRFKLRVPTEALGIGSHSILVRVTDGVGLSSVDRKCELEVLEPADTKAEPGPDGGPR